MSEKMNTINAFFFVLLKINKFLKYKSQNNQFNNLSVAAINVNIRIRSFMGTS